MPCFGSICHIFSRAPLILRDVYAMQTIVWHILGAHCLQVWRVGVVRVVFRGALPACRSQEECLGPLLKVGEVVSLSRIRMKPKSNGYKKMVPEVVHK